MKKEPANNSEISKAEELPIEEVESHDGVTDWNASAWMKILANQEANLREGKPVADWYSKPRLSLATMTLGPSFKDEYLAVLADENQKALKKQSLMAFLAEKSTKTLYSVLKVCIHEQQDEELQELIRIELKQRGEQGLHFV